MESFLPDLGKFPSLPLNMPYFLIAASGIFQIHLLWTACYFSVLLCDCHMKYSCLHDILVFSNSNSNSNWKSLEHDLQAALAESEIEEN